MNREYNLLKNTVIISIGKICTQMISFFLLPFYTYLLTTEEYGTVDLLNTLVSLLLPIVTFQVEQAVFRELIDVRDSKKNESIIISNAFFSVCLQCLIYLLIFVIISPWIKNEYKFYLAINVIASIFSSLLLQISRGLGNNIIYSFGSFISALLTILCNILFLIFFKMKVEGMLLGTLLGQLGCFLFLFFSLKIYKYLHMNEFKKNICLKLWKYSLPLVPNSISWWIFTASDRIIVSIFLGLSFNGILSAASKFSTVFITFYNIFNISWTESISVHINDFDISVYFNKMFNIIIRIFISLILITLMIMPYVYLIMVNESFFWGIYLIPVLLIGVLFNISVGLLSVIYIAKKNTRAIANTSIISACINILTHLALINSIGLVAAPLSSFIAYFIMFVYRMFDVNNRYFKVSIDKKNLFLMLIILPIVILVFYINNIILNFITLFIICIILIFINYKEIIVFFNSIKIFIQKNFTKVS